MRCSRGKPTQFPPFARVINVKKDMNSREATNYLKGFAILAVLVNHFINTFLTPAFKGYASGFIAIFFVLSGYGIYHSLKKQVNKPPFGFIAYFFRKRLLRIYPLFWIICILLGFPDGILGFLGLNLIDPATPWFIPSILMCYLVAPLLFIFTNRIEAKYSFIIIITGLGLINIALFSAGLPVVKALAYRRIFFLHIFLFYLGLLLAKTERYISSNKYLFFLSFFFLLFFIHETGSQASLSFFGKDYIFPMFFSSTVLICCASLLSSKITLPLKRAMIFMGIHSYSIYLFHIVHFKILSTLGIVEYHNTTLSGVAIWLLSLPLFIILIAAFETVVNEFVFGDRKFKNAYDIYIKKLLPST